MATSSLIGCPACNGKGTVVMATIFGNQQIREMCATCNGSGMVPGCPSCNLMTIDFDNSCCDCDEVALEAVA